MTRDYSTLTYAELSEARSKWNDRVTTALAQRNLIALRHSANQSLAILDEYHRRALKPRRHFAPERGRGRGWDSQNAGGE